MAFCAKCGASLGEGAAFCPSCGVATGAAPSATMTPEPAATAAPMSSNVAAALGYIPYVGFIVAIVFLVIEPYRRDPFVRFHAFQSIFLAAAAAIFWIIWGTLFGLLSAASLGILSFPLVVIWAVLRIGLFVLWLLMMYKAYNNDRFLLPYIGPMAAKQAGA